MGDAVYCMEGETKSERRLKIVKWLKNKPLAAKDYSRKILKVNVIHFNFPLTSKRTQKSLGGGVKVNGQSARGPCDKEPVNISDKKSNWR